MPAWQYPFYGFFYRAMHYSAKRCVPITCRLSVRPSLSEVGRSLPHRWKNLKTNCPKISPTPSLFVAQRSSLFYTMKTMCYIHCYLSKTTMVTSCDADAIIASSHPMMTNATLFTDKYINIVIKCLLCNLFGFACSPLSLDFCSIAFWQFPINEYVMLCYPPTPRGTWWNFGETRVRWEKVACWSTKTAISLKRVKIREKLLYMEGL